jgi:hypothetical protein
VHGSARPCFYQVLDLFASRLRLGAVALQGQEQIGLSRLRLVALGLVSVSSEAGWPMPGLPVSAM